MTKKIAVFGSAVLPADTKEYKLAEEAGKLISKNQFIVLCGGYGGIMEAVCKGASLSGGICEGVGLKIFKNKPNSYITSFCAPETLGERLDYFMEKSDAFLALYGGIGTVTEVMFVWDNLKAREMTKPLFLLGEFWEDYLRVLKENFIIKPDHFKKLKKIKDLNFLDAELKKI